MDLNGCAMANQGRQFGVTNSADVKLQICGPNGEEYEGNPLHLHSQTLQKSEFFKTLLSDRWSLDIRPLEIEVTTSQSFENYLKCIEMMCSSSPARFSDVDECLAILSVASELLVDKLMQQCMEYLEAVPWNSEQESKIRNLLSSLNLSILPDLNARLNKQSSSYIDFIGENVKSMIYFLSNEDRPDEKQPNIREAVGKFIVDNLQGDASSGVADLCRHIILDEFRANIAIAVSSNMENNPTDEEHISFVLLWPFTLIERCDGMTMEGAVKILCEEVKLADIKMQERQYSAAIRHRKIMLPILLWCLEVLGKGKIIVERKLRVSFLTAWLPVMAQLIHSGRRLPGRIKIKEEDVLKTQLCRGVSNVIETLPLADWKGIYKIWTDCCDRNYIDLSIPFARGCKLLHELHE
ncbi:hypothetical protein SUGI_1069420 [Cryptomeria japonica]|uniref:BTB/POZ domain-containing protein At1g63850-like n=1 Tax=Cryptomeria japonica TaxID=3369 RepID=UPI002414AB60|nr:BTB/POZ domain-containing protein At1g63850-like [Cryptomeria japonica]GLJ50236.1 hypothetical protein SUGI_1069420 [Cryptomeria japonica]